MLERGSKALVFRCIADLLFQSESLGVVKHGAVEQPGVNDLLATKLDAALDDLSDEFPLPLVGGVEGADARFMNFGEQPGIFVVEQGLLLGCLAGIALAVRGRVPCAGA